MPDPKPAILVTIDTEPDDLWSFAKETTTRNARFLPRFQALCEKNGLRPTYLVDYDMARDDDFRRFGRSVISAGTAEIGMHLHAWSTPPFFPLDNRGLKPYLVEYTEEAIAAKIDSATDAIIEAFGVRPSSHRAGRWAFDERYLRVLESRGYLVDCSVTPFAPLKPSSASSAYKPRGFESFPTRAYFMDRDDISRPGGSAVLELPMTVRRPGGIAASALSALSPRATRKIFPLSWFRPDGTNLQSLLDLARRAEARGEYLEFMIHSSELMPEGSPSFPDAASVERLYSDLETLFSAVHGSFECMTLREYRAFFVGRSGRTV